SAARAPLILLSPFPLPDDAPAGVTRLDPDIPLSRLAADIARLLERRPASLGVPTPPPSPLLQRARLLETHSALQNRVRELDALLEMGKTVVSTFDVDAILRKVVNAAVDLTGAEEGYLLLVDRASGELYLRAERNLQDTEARNFQTRISDSIARQVVETGEPFFIARRDEGLKIKTGAIVYALINVPLRFGETIIGVLGVHRRAEKSFDQNDLRVAQALADWAAIAITNARLYREAKRGSKSTELVNEISRSILTSLHTAEIPHQLIKHATEIIGAECGSLALVDAAAGELVFELAYDGQGREIKPMRGLRLPLGRGIIGAVAADGKPRIVNEVRKEALWYAEIDRLLGFTTRQILAAPLKTKGKVIGVVELLNKGARGFDDDDQVLLMAAASAAAIAIQNARQFEVLETTLRELESAQEKRIAAEQWSIMGRAAANLAHRIHNTTSIVPLAVQDLRELLEQADIPPEIQSKVAANLSRIERNVTYTINLANDLMHRFRQDAGLIHDVNQAVQKALAALHLPDNITLQTNLAPNLPPVDISSLLVDAIVELLNNAVEAMPGGGTLTVATLRRRKTLAIQITDTGPGIPPAVRRKMFKLFFSKKDSGLGFGLWWAKTFLQQYGGTIRVRSKEGEGSTFTVSLPIAPPRIDLTAGLE
ncbi:MAG: GAF domain-containing protein, partial [Caldilineae bacterium]